jgi:hypothetical protein
MIFFWNFGFPPCSKIQPELFSKVKKMKKEEKNRESREVEGTMELSVRRTEVAIRKEARRKESVRRKGEEKENEKIRTLVQSSYSRRISY